ncbi:MAG TPA: response regulator transcription factor [Baekduia sp.]|uniref:response regulator transcription factor n=1 Tax=Baekduia sp. TaxID=2600305 RepID=UPI002CFD2AF5|nr:response regulator transcription factor [Baekduia sp.]HMJ36246.1 response regulator transcription factor [Baekduia sp.]
MSRVLVIDDEPRIVSFVRRALGADGIAADGVTSGARGLELALTGMYELVILDLLMPGMDGTSVLTQTMARRPQQSVVVLSALTDVETKVRCFGIGATDYIGKPFALAELLARVRARLRPNGSVGGEALLTAGGLRMDVRRRTADAGAGPVSISDREFLLLQHLMSHAGDVCTREEILADVWGCSFDPATNVVDVYVGRLRSKLGAYAVETVRNVGYCVHA